MNLPELFEEYRVHFIVGLAGLFLLGVGVLSVVILSVRQSEPEVEIISVDEGQEKKDLEIMVDIEGAVENPGVYKLSSDARVNDALVAAGGLSAEADRIWVARYINLAQSMVDGVKIYVPLQGEEKEVSPNFSSSAVSTDQGQVIGVETQGMININNASASELDSLWGIGEKRATDIIGNRPYGSIDELLTKKIIPSNVFERIKDQIGIY